MRRLKLSKKWIAILATVFVLVLTASITGVVLAADSSNSGTTATNSPAQTLLDKVVAIYQQKTGVTLDEAALKESIAQAKKEMNEDAIKTRLQALVSEGKLTQDQADQILSWWQAKPDVLNGIGLGDMPGLGHGMRGFCLSNE